MSFLYPLVLAGVAAVALPIVLHMIRRHTRRRVAFSSLMFLRPEVPRLRNRTRIENLFLLFLRCLALCLLALAFARPFFPRPAVVNAATPTRRVVVLLDTSASMRRAGLWEQAVEHARSALNDLGPVDRACLMSFDREARTLIGFEQWETMGPGERVKRAEQLIAGLSLGWHATDLGQSLVAAAEAVEDDETRDAASATTIRQIVLISDLQRGSDLRALLAYEWPERTQVLVRPIPTGGATNASVHLVTARERSTADDVQSVRVTNSSEATRERFRIAWARAADGPASSREVYVPPGHSIVVPAPPRIEDRTAGRLVLTGDDHAFDNVVYVAPRLEQQINILFVGADDPNDPDHMLFYLTRAFRANGPMPGRVVSRPGDEPLAADQIEAAHLIIVGDAVSPPNASALRRCAESGRTLLVVMRSAQAGTTLSLLADLAGLRCREADPEGYAMFGQMEFDHPLLVPFADPRYGDFTRIHAWQYRRLDIPNAAAADVLARYDNGDPAWIEIGAGDGSLLVWTCGWHPADSDMALSSKFVPLLYSALEYGGAWIGREPQYFVGDHVPVPEWATATTAGRHIRKPDGSSVRLDASQQSFAQTDEPGVYTIDSPSGTRRFAINLPPSESRTDPLPVEELERVGVSLEPPARTEFAEAGQSTRQKSLAAMESEQKLWRWLLLAALVVLLAETWLAGWLARPAPASEGDVR
jgi:hypothetical protein